MPTFNFGKIDLGSHGVGHRDDELLRERATTPAASCSTPTLKVLTVKLGTGTGSGTGVAAQTIDLHAERAR